MDAPTRYQICTRGLWDTTVPGIAFDENGVSNYAKMFERMIEAYPRGEQGKEHWQQIVGKIKKKGKSRRYDCVIGVSGGTDSSYLMHLARQYGLRPLAVTLDNGWSSEIAVKNIKKVTTKLGIDLETYVVDYEEMKDIHRSYLKASLPWADFPTDLAIKAALYKIAKKEKLKYILIGHDFRSEGTQPSEWTHGDAKQLLHIQRQFGALKIKTFPFMTFPQFFYNGYVKGIKMIRPYFFLEYQKKAAQQFLTQEYGWEYYGGHHHENLFTKFAIAHWLPQKFGIDKRIITLSAQVMSGEITREEALQQILKPPYDPDRMERDKVYVIKKLGLTEEEFQEIWTRPNKTFMDYPSYYPALSRFIQVAEPIIKLMLPHRPMTLFEIEMRDTKD